MLSHFYMVVRCSVFRNDEEVGIGSASEFVRRKWEAGKNGKITEGRAWETDRQRQTKTDGDTQKYTETEIDRDRGRQRATKESDRQETVGFRQKIGIFGRDGQKQGDKEI